MLGVKLFGNVGLSVHGDWLKKSNKNESERELAESESEREEEEEDPRSNWSFCALSPLSIELSFSSMVVSVIKCDKIVFANSQRTP